MSIDYLKGLATGVAISIVISVLSYIVTATQDDTFMPNGEYLTIEYRNSTPYERTIGVELTNSITNTFKIMRYSMDKYSYKVFMSNPLENH